MNAEAEKRQQEIEERQRVKAEIKRNRQRIRAVCNSLVADGSLDEDHLQELCLKTPVEQLGSLADNLEAVAASEQGGKDLIIARCKEALERVEKATAAEEEQKNNVIMKEDKKEVRS